MAVARTIPSQARTDLLTFTIKIEGEQISSTYQVKNITIHKEINKIPYARVRIVDGDPSAETFAVSDTETFIPGKNIEILLGYHSEETTVFKGIITSHSNSVTNSSSELFIECKDVAVRMTVAKSSKHYNDVKDSDIAEELITKYQGIEAEVEATTIDHKDIVQYNTSDWDFVLNRMDSIGCICIISDGKFTTKKPALSEDAKLNVLYGATILNYRAEVDSRNQYKAVKATTWNFSNQEVTEVDAAEPSWTEGGDITNTTLADVMAVENYKVLHPGNLGQDALQALADAKLLKTRLSKIRGTVTYQGNADVQPGDFIGLNGVGNRFNGKAIASSIHHECEEGVWTTEVTFGLDPQWYADKVQANTVATEASFGTGISGLQIGLVTSNEDPLSENRVQVKLPMISAEQEGIWARVSTLDAGNNRGTFFRPDVGDEVIVGFIGSNVSYPVILGMLNSSAMPAPLEAANANNEKGYVSRSQIKMIFNDDEKSFKLETPGGNKITLSDQDKLIKIEDQNGNKITMEEAGITIESASDLKLKASGDLTVEAANVTISPSSSFAVSAGGCEVKAGSGSASLKAPSVTVEGSGTTTIKGGIVQIN